MPQNDTSGEALRLQDGIYFRSGEGPPRSYRLVLLNVSEDATPARARTAIASVWAMLRELRDGVVEDLKPERVDHGNLTCLLGFGARLFDPGRNLTPNGQRPERLVRPDHDGYGPFPRLKWVESEGRPDEADLALQLIGDTELAVNRAVVEVYRLIRQEPRSLELVTFYGGFNREDKRSWLNFHDGVSNLHASERAAAIEVPVANPPWDPGWMVGGTYMVFLRLALKLEDWWTLPRNLQEIIVGRDKLSGCPLESVEEPGLVPVPAPGCPLRPGHPEVAEHKDPQSPPLGQLVALSHMHRVNPTRRGPTSSGSNRIFRQGYEFLEPLAEGRLRPGLNFVSFQCDLARFENILTTAPWLKTVNFGGPDDRSDIPNIELARIMAGGYYAVPPKAVPPSFPGAEIFLEGA